MRGATGFGCARAPNSYRKKGQRPRASSELPLISPIRCVLAARSAAADLRLGDAIEAISEAFVLWDHDNRLVTCNSKFRKLHGLPAERLEPGIPYAEVMSRGTAAGRAG